MMLPTIIYPTGNYVAALRIMAWEAAGWAVSCDGEAVEVWGPKSIARSVDLDICELTGCLDSRAGSDG